MIWLGILIGFGIALVLGYIFNVVEEIYKQDKYFLGPYHCNHCERTIFDEEAKYCAFCGRELTLHMDNPLFEEFAIEMPNNIENENIINEEN